VTTIVIGFLMILPLVFHFQLFLHFTFLHFTSNAPVAFLTIPKGTSRISFGQHCGLTTDGTQNDGAACNKILNQSHTAGQVEACPLLSWQTLLLQLNSNRSPFSSLKPKTEGMSLETSHSS
jgi:hypothetical protein